MMMMSTTANATKKTQKLMDENKAVARWQRQKGGYIRNNQFEARAGVSI
jgi:hypothetical protein